MNRAQEARSVHLLDFLRRIDIQTLQKNGIHICEMCEGTGLSGYTRMGHSDYSWDGQSYCDNCKGVGFDGLEKSKSVDGIHYVCGLCNGVGCEDCHQTGFTDWISHSMGR